MFEDIISFKQYTFCIQDTPGHNIIEQIPMIDACFNFIFVVVDVYIKK